VKLPIGGARFVESASASRIAKRIQSVPGDGPAAPIQSRDSAGQRRDSQIVSRVCAGAYFGGSALHLGDMN
jgi:hypothetical protein